MPKKEPKSSLIEKSSTQVPSAELSTQLGIFKSNESGRQKRKAPPEEKLAIVALKRNYYKELENGLKEDLGEDYTDEDTEICWKALIEELRKNGTIQRMLDKYIQDKIRREREKFAASIASMPKKIAQ